MENPIKMDDLGVPLFLDIFGNTHVSCFPLYKNTQVNPGPKVYMFAPNLKKIQTYGEDRIGETGGGWQRTVSR